MASTEPCSPLPPEVWGNVLSYIDDPFDLWITCRQISNGIKVEAERAFCRGFLPDLRIIWSIVRCPNMYNQTAVHVCAELDDTIIIDTTTSSALFNILVKDSDCSDDISNEERENLVVQALRYQDYNAATRTSKGCAISKHDMQMYFDKRTTPQAALQANYWNDPEILDIDVHFAPSRKHLTFDMWEDRGHISFDWKKAMTTYFAEELWVRRQSAYTAVNNSQPPSLAGLLVDFRSELATRCPSLKETTVRGRATLTITPDEEESFDELRNQYYTAVASAYLPDYQHLYTEAYKKRLLKAQVKHGNEGTSEGGNPTSIESYVRRRTKFFRKERLDYVTSIAAQYWLQEIGVDEGAHRRWMEQNPDYLNVSSE